MSPHVITIPVVHYNELQERAQVLDSLARRVARYLIAHPDKKLEEALQAWKKLSK